MKPATPTLVSCPICGASVPWVPENKWKPFCSERCKLIDLGQWATEKYRVPAGEQAPEDEPPRSRSDYFL